jgi:hypothetical protein
MPIDLWRCGKLWIRKSSLVRAGLIPNLEAGFLVQDRDLWKIAIFKPGDSPLRNLAAAIVAVSGATEAGESVSGLRAMVSQARQRWSTESNPHWTSIEQSAHCCGSVRGVVSLSADQDADVREEAADFVPCS